MSTTALPDTEIDNAEQIDKRFEIQRRFLLAGFADTSLFDDIPFDVTLFLIPDDDPAFAEQEIAAAAASARDGRDVYVRHVRVADLPS